LLALITFFFNDFSETNYLRIRWIIFTPNESVLGVDDRSEFFSNISRDVAMATNFVAKWGKITYPLHLSLCHSETE